MRVIAVAVLSVFSFLGCATPQERAQELARTQAEQEAQRQAYAQSIVNRCAGYGFRPGTDAFANCIRQEHTETQRCARVRNSLALQYNLILMQESSKPGARYFESVARAAAQTPSPSEYGC